MGQMKRKRPGLPIFLMFISMICIIAIAGGYLISRDDKPEQAVKPQNVVASTTSSSIEKSIQTKQSPKKEKKHTENTFFQQESNVDQKLNDLIKDMSLEEKVGQLIVVGFPSKTVDQHIKTMINKYKVGGVILYDRNMDSPRQVAGLTYALQGLATKNSHQIPLIVSIDQEGGPVVRMKEHVSTIPSQQELSRMGSQDQVYETAYRNGQELKLMGINVNYAPVLDLSTQDSRSFGENPKKTQEFGKQVIKGLNDAGITATLKHFPGNGRSNVDPHLETSSVQANQLDLENNDIYPFKQMVDEQEKHSFFIMVTHIKYPAYDSQNPASLSSVIIEQLLRGKLGYKGIVVTDDLEMGAVSKYYRFNELGYRAVQAGADLLLVCHTLDSQKQVINGVIEAVHEKKISEDRIDESVKRILAYKLANIRSIHVNEQNAEKLVGK